MKDQPKNEKEKTYADQENRLRLRPKFIRGWVVPGMLRVPSFPNDEDASVLIRPSCHQ